MEREEGAWWKPSRRLRSLWASQSMSQSVCLPACACACVGLCVVCACLCAPGTCWRGWFGRPPHFPSFFLSGLGCGEGAKGESGRRRGPRVGRESPVGAEGEGGSRGGCQTFPPQIARGAPLSEERSCAAAWLAPSAAAPLRSAPLGQGSRDVGGAAEPPRGGGRGGAAGLRLPPAGHQQLRAGGRWQARPQTGPDRTQQVRCY